MTFEELQRDHPEYFESAFKRIKHEPFARMLDIDPNYSMSLISVYLKHEFDKVKDELEKELA